eukprot:CAMPEP_0170458324 /NCGR_PEP_ID=MMETSP0123-20130129/5321_1 /TAXON_ID=182087 /ORGANISM="Favella ehrenbergii, Strain Fehren 1" /LENGTH=121 /DNA_ID=CAMNT_0010722413 /DNA_START=126 /DNA_END=492 /DNA_ORIENTATION=-
MPQERMEKCEINTEEVLGCVIVLAAVPAIFAEKALLVQFELLVTTCLGQFLGLSEVETHLTSRGGALAHSCAEDLLLHLLGEDLARLGRVTVLVLAVETGLDLTCLLLVRRLAESAAENVL